MILLNSLFCYRYLVLSALVMFLDTGDNEVHALLTSPSPRRCANQNYRAANGTCLPCTACPKGQQPSKACDGINDTECEPCPMGMWSDVESATSTCHYCTSGRKCLSPKRIRYCTAVSDSMCDTCGENKYYYPHAGGCVHCEHCDADEFEASPCTFEADRVCLEKTNHSITRAFTPTTFPLPQTVHNQSTSVPRPPRSRPQPRPTPTPHAHYTEPSTMRNSSSSEQTLAIAISLSIAGTAIITISIFCFCCRKRISEWMSDRKCSRRLKLSYLPKKSLEIVAVEMATLSVDQTANMVQEDPNYVSPVWKLVTGASIDHKDCFQKFANDPPTPSQESRVRDLAKQYLLWACQNGTSIEEVYSQLLRCRLNRAAVFLEQQLPARVRRELKLETVLPERETQTLQEPTVGALPTEENHPPASDQYTGLNDLRDQNAEDNHLRLQKLSIETVV